MNNEMREKELMLEWMHNHKGEGMATYAYNKGYNDAKNGVVKEQNTDGK